MDMFETYLKNKYDSYRKINTMATRDNERELKDIYIPLELVELKQGGEEDVEVPPIVVNGFPERFAERNRKNLIVDTAGMGKSTLVKRIFIDLADSRKYIPVFIELRRLSDRKTIMMEIGEMLGVAKDEVKTAEIKNVFKTGEFVFILDGYDEVPQEFKESVTIGIRKFVEEFGNNIFIMTSRPEDSFLGFQNFDCYRISPLTKKMAFELLEKHDNHGEVSKLLIKKLKENVYGTISEYLTNPLLVSMLYAAFDFKQTIPLKKHLFYEQVYDAYFEKHDLTKGGGFRHQKQSNLDSYDFDRILRAVGFNSLKKQRVEYNYNEFLDTIKIAQEFCKDLKFKSTDFKSDLLEAVPLFCKEGFYYKWVHKSMQEYFAARFIYMDSKYSQDELLTALYNSPRIEHYYNLFDIYYDIDVFSFKKNIIYPLLCAFRDFFIKTYHTLDNIPDALVRERVGLLFLRQIYMGDNQSESADADFDFFEKKCKKMNFIYTNMVSYTINGARFCIVKNIDPHRRLLDLLHSRMPELFVNVQRKRNFELEKIRPYDFVTVTGADDFADNEDSYIFCNVSLEKGVDGSSYYLDYNKVLEEIGKIELSLIKKDEIKELVSGL